MADQMTGILSPFLRARRIAEAVPYLGTGRVLDYGCGVGELARYVEAERYVGVDVDPESVKEASVRYPEHQFFVGKAFDSGPQVAGFDVIVALALIEHIDNPAKWMEEMTLLLAPSGKLVLTTPHPSFRFIHDLGAKIGIFSREASEEHKELIDRNAMVRIAHEGGVRLIEYRRFLMGCNQIAIFIRKLD